MTGVVKQQAGKATGDDKLRGAGTTQKVKGEGQDTFGNVKGKAAEIKDKVTQ